MNTVQLCLQTIVFGMILTLSASNYLDFFSRRCSCSLLTYRNSSFSNLLDQVYSNIQNQTLAFYDYTCKICKGNKDDFDRLQCEAREMLHLAQDCDLPDDHYHDIIDQTVSLAEQYKSLDSQEYWDYLGHEEDIRVWRLKKSLRCDPQEDKWPCVRSVTTVDIPVKQLKRLIMDSSKVKIFNKYSGGRIDVHHIGKNTKIVWNRTKIPLAIKPYDFCTLMHAVDDEDNGEAMIISKGIEDPRVPIKSDFSRSEVIFALQVLCPSKHDESKTEFTTISHVKYAGTHPFLAWRSAFQGSVSYFRHLKSTIKKYKNTGGFDYPDD